MVSKASFIALTTMKGHEFYIKPVSIEAVTQLDFGGSAIQTTSSGVYEVSEPVATVLRLTNDAAMAETEETDRDE